MSREIKMKEMVIYGRTRFIMSIWKKKTQFSFMFEKSNIELINLLR